MHQGTRTHRDFGSRFFPATISPFLLATLVSKEAKYFKELKFLGLVRYFSSWIEKLLKNCKSTQKSTLFWWFFKVYSIFGWKIVDQTNKFEFLDVFCFFWYPCWLQKWRNSGDIAVFIIFIDIFWLWRHLAIFSLFSK